MLNPPLVDGMYPVTPLIDALGFQAIESVLSTPDADTVTVLAQDPEAIEVVPRLAVPLAIVTVPVPVGTAHDPSARRKFEVPPPEPGTTP